MVQSVAVEFKRCGNGIRNNTYETVCSFLNRFGSDLFLGGLDDGTVEGFTKQTAMEMIRNFIKVISNPTVFTPTIYLVPEIIEADGKVIIHIHVPVSAEVHSYKRVIFDRIDDADVKVTSTAQIAQMYIRKQNIFTEKKIYPCVEINDLRLDLLPKVRLMAVNHAGGEHPWAEMTDMELLSSAGLYGKDRMTGEKGFNLACVLLLGKDEVIRDICPSYQTDALVRKVNGDRFDDRETVSTNLIESYERLINFAKKNLPDKFFLEDISKVSLRNIIAREMISNALMHREYSSSFMAKFVIEKNCMYVENANRANGDGYITLENLEPASKNPLIASFFRNIGLADNPGSGTRKLFRYSRFYSGSDPVLKDGDIFRITVPLDDSYSYDSSVDKRIETYLSNHSPLRINSQIPEVDAPLTLHEKNILTAIKTDPYITQDELADMYDLSNSGVRYIMTGLKKRGLLYRAGSKKRGKWVTEY